MDNIRGRFPGQDGSDGGGNDHGPGDDEAGRDLPPAAIGQDERRMQVRAYNFWASALQDRNFPSISELVPEEQSDFGPHSVLLDFSAGMDDPKVVYLGEELALECGAQGTIRSLADVPGRSLLSRITDHYMQILANQAPIGFEAEFVNQRGSTILYRGILLPYSSDDATIDFIYGVINWKELADQRTTDELLLQIDQALEPKKLGGRDPLPMTEWADGPTDGSGSLAFGDAAPAAGDPVDFPAPAFGAMSRDVEARYQPAYEPVYEAPPPLEETAADSTYHAELPGEGPMSLHDWLASARQFASRAHGCEDRSRRALYAAVGCAYDFSLAATEAKDDYARILSEAGLTVQDRAPWTPIVKLVFGGGYDKTRLTEYAAVLNHAHRLGLERGALGTFLADAPGGLKAVVADERRLRREADMRDAAQTDARKTPREALARKLRKLECHPLADLPAQGSEFTVLVARRLPDGEVVVLGEVAEDTALMERAARRLLQQG